MREKKGKETPEKQLLYERGIGCGEVQVGKSSEQVTERDITKPGEAEPGGRGLKGKHFLGTHDDRKSVMQLQLWNWNCWVPAVALALCLP